MAVLDPLALRARRVRALFLCGLQEGLFPAPARPEPYLSEEERRGLAEASGLRLGRPGDALAAERYLLYAAISRPLELLVLSWHTTDDDGLASGSLAVRGRHLRPLLGRPKRENSPSAAPPSTRRVRPAGAGRGISAGISGCSLGERGASG